MARSWGGTLARKITEQSNMTAGLRFQSGVATLVAGQAVVPNVRLTANSNFQFTLYVRDGTMGGHYMPDLVTLGESGSFRINSLDAAAALQNMDTSEICWVVIS
jgi:hypothetical protein